jgi:hypothetical protein
MNTEFAMAFEGLTGVLPLLPRCAVRAELGRKLADTIQHVYRLRADGNAAQPKGATQDALLNLLQKARTDQRQAEKAFSDHVKEHGCGE